MVERPSAYSATWSVQPEPFQYLSRCLFERWDRGAVGLVVCGGPFVGNPTHIALPEGVVTNREAVPYFVTSDVSTDMCDVGL